jgi:hypothetical protein
LLSRKADFRYLFARVSPHKTFATHTKVPESGIMADADAGLMLWSTGCRWAMARWIVGPLDLHVLHGTPPTAGIVLHHGNLFSGLLYCVQPPQLQISVPLWLLFNGISQSLSLLFPITKLDGLCKHSYAPNQYMQDYVSTEGSYTNTKPTILYPTTRPVHGKADFQMHQARCGGARECGARGCV